MAVAEYAKDRKYTMFVGAIWPLSILFVDQLDAGDYVTAVDSITVTDDSVVSKVTSSEFTTNVVLTANDDTGGANFEALAAGHTTINIIVTTNDGLTLSDYIRVEVKAIPAS